jgi:hypothetical protein
MHVHKGHHIRQVRNRTANSLREQSLSGRRRSNRPNSLREQSLMFARVCTADRAPIRVWVNGAGNVPSHLAAGA